MANEHQGELTVSPPLEEGPNYPLRPPNLLQSIVYTEISDNILQKCVQQLCREENRQSIDPVRTYFQRLPVFIRSSLLKRSLSIDSARAETVISPAPFVIIQILLQEDMERLECGNTSFLPTSYLKELFQSLIDKTQGFKVLQLPPRAAFEKNNPLPLNLQHLATNLVINNSNVTHLGLPTICNDNILRVIGELCCCLEHLDISCSKVTDSGIESLVQCFACGCANDTLVYILNTVKNVFTNSQHICSKVSTELCSSLLKINLEGTDVSVKALSMLLEHVKFLLNVGKEIDELFDNLYKHYQEEGEIFVFPNWCLQFVVIQNLTENRLFVLKEICSSISELAISSSIDNDDTVIPSFNNYIKECGKTLTKLRIMLPHKDTEKDFLSVVLKHCENLECFHVTCHSIFWGDDKTPVPALYLKDGCLKCEISAEDAKLLLESATFLQEIYFDNITNSCGFLISLCGLPISNLLTKFIIRAGNVLVYPREVLGFWMINQQIKSIGYVKFGLEELGLVENANLELIKNN